MLCPIFIKAREDFCLIENCRYYDQKYERCTYSEKREKSEIDHKKSPAEEQSEKKQSKEITVTFIDRQKGKYDDNMNIINHKKQDIEPVEMSAKELWDKLVEYHRSIGIPNYEEIIRLLITCVKNTDKIHYMTKKDMDFWYNEIADLKIYRHYLEGKAGIEEYTHKGGVL